MRITSRLSLVGSLQYGLAGPFDCSVYAIRGPGGVVLIDSGGGTHTDTLIGNLREDTGAAVCSAVLLTHCHPDHAAGASSLRELTRCAVLAPEVSRAAIENADETVTGLRAGREAGVYPTGFQLRPCPVDEELVDGKEVDVCGLAIRPIHVAGHSLDSTALLVELDGQRLLFTGDILFYGGVLGLINTEGSELAGYRRDIHKLGGLGVDALLPGHGMFTLVNGQKHVDCAIEQMAKGFVPRMVGQGDLIF